MIIQCLPVHEQDVWLRLFTAALQLMGDGTTSLPTLLDALNSASG
jgi:hypothetical protein